VYGKLYRGFESHPLRQKKKAEGRRQKTEGRRQKAEGTGRQNKKKAEGRSSGSKE
jgi:hypothetical protein